MFLGCTAEVRDKFTRQLGLVQTFHPMVLPVLFADIERNKMERLVERLNGKLKTKAWNIPRAQHEASSSKPNVDVQKLIEYAASEEVLSAWSVMRGLSNGLKSWQAQLDQVITHVEGFHSETLFGTGSTCPAGATGMTSYRAGSSDGYSPTEEARTPVNDQLSAAPGGASPGIDTEEEFVKMNARILRRLRELREEYTIHERTCSTALEITSLAHQVVSSTLDRRRPRHSSIQHQMFLASLPCRLF